VRTSSRSRIGSLLALLVVLIAVVVLAAIVLATRSASNAPPSGATGSPPGAASGAAGTGGKRVFGHVYVIVLENHSLSQALAAMPYLKQLGADGASATNYRGVTHPSQPNYIALFGGDTYGITNNSRHDLAAPNLADQLEKGGHSWAVSAENYPGGCFKGATAKGGDDGAGTYARKHNPAISFKSISGSPVRCARIHDLSSFDAGEADFQLIVPNLCNDAHDCPLGTADAWLREFVPQVTDSEAFRKDGVLFVTFDEDDSKGENIVPLVAVGASVKPGATSDHAYTHYSLLRTIEDNWALGCLARACDATPLDELFRAPNP